MKYLKLFESIGFDDWDEDETPDNEFKNMPEDLIRIDFKRYIGCKVKIRKDSKYYKENDILGTIDIIYPTNNAFGVTWDDGRHNGYTVHDLQTNYNENLHEDINWVFDEDETPDEINPYDLEFPINLTVNNKLKEYISKNGWTNEMNYFIGKTFEVLGIYNIDYTNLDGKRIRKHCYKINGWNTQWEYFSKWWIPFDCMEHP